MTIKRQGWIGEIGSNQPHVRAGDWESTDLHRRQRREDILALHHWQRKQVQLEKELSHARQRLIEIWSRLGVNSGGLIEGPGSQLLESVSETADPGNGVGAAESTHTEESHD
jgi:hypothetical protein